MIYGDLQFFDILIFAAIAGFIIYRLRSVLGKRTGFQKNIPNDRFSQHLYENIISANESFEKKNNLDKYKKKYEFEISLIKSIFKKERNYIYYFTFAT